MTKEELYFEKDQEVLSENEWENIGKPKMWFKMYDKDGIKIFEDRAYGAVKLITPQGENQGTDMVVVKDVVVFGPYYEGVSKIYIPYKAISI